VFSVWEVILKGVSIIIIPEEVRRGDNKQKGRVR
jgi:hypothetical protein